MSNRISNIGSNLKKYALLPTFGRILIGCFISELQTSTSGPFRRTFRRRLRARTAQKIKDRRIIRRLCSDAHENHERIGESSATSIHSSHQGVYRTCRRMEISLWCRSAACYPIPFEDQIRYLLGWISGTSDWATDRFTRPKGILKAEIRFSVTILR